MRILVTGSRRADTADHITTIRGALIKAVRTEALEALAGGLLSATTDTFTWDRDVPLENQLHSYSGASVTLMHGKCPYGGADLIAHHAAAGWGWNIETYPAETTPDGRILGPARNARMVAVHQAHPIDVCLAFPGTSSRGTWDCIRKAVDAGIRTIIEPLKDCP